MKKNKAFTLAEMLIVIVIIGVVISLGMPLIIKDSKSKIQNTQFYEAYRAIYEGAKKARMASPSKKFDLYRADNRFGISVCDLFASIYSLSDIKQGGVKSRVKCIETDPDNLYNGLCRRDYAFTPANEKCPLDSKFKRTKYAQPCCPKDTPCIDSFITGCSTVTEDKDGYCMMLPNYYSSYDRCADSITKNSPVYEYSPGGTDEKVFIDQNVQTSVSGVDYNTDFDKTDVIPDFTTANGLAFYGFSKYPARVVQDYNDIVFAERMTALAFLYRDIYIDTNGKSKKKHKSCAPCDGVSAYHSSFVASTGPTVDLASQEASMCAAQLECLKNTYGVYKFRLYNNGRVEPITNRSNGNTKMRYKLIYVANKEIVEVEQLFKKYADTNSKSTDAARSYEISSGDRDFMYWNRNKKHTVGITSGGDPLDWYNNKDTMQYNQPCLYDMDTLECAIIPVIPEVNPLPIKSKTTP